jgi:colanic acid/amylovoran biosynthesis protein
VSSSRSPKSILITHVYSADNKGDAALLSVLISELKSVFPNSALRIHTLDDIDPGELYDGVPVSNSLMHCVLSGHRNRLAKLFDALVMVTWTRVWASLFALSGITLPLPARWRRVIDDYLDADVVVGVGGGYLRGRRGWISTIELLLLTHPLHLAHSLGKPTVLSSMSVGPFAGTVQEGLFKRGVAKTEAIFVREDVSQQLLRELRVRVPVIRAVDAGFAFTTSQRVALRELMHVSTDRVLVGITVRKWLPARQQTDYEAAIAAAADHLIATHGVAVVFVPQVTSVRNNDDDRVTSRRVHSLMAHQHDATVLNESVDHHYIKALCAELDLMIGTRFHSVIFSLTSLVPCVAIEYEHKTAGIMAELDLSDWVVRIEDVSGSRFLDLVDRAYTSRASYAEYLAAVMPAYVERCADTKLQLVAIGRAASGPRGTPGPRR